MASNFPSLINDLCSSIVVDLKIIYVLYPVQLFISNKDKIVEKARTGLAILLLFVLRYHTEYYWSPVLSSPG